VPSTAPLPQVKVAPFTTGNPSFTADFITLTSQRNIGAEDLVYRWEQAADPASTTWEELPVVPVSTTMIGTTPNAEVTVRLATPLPSGQPRNFIRLRVSRN
jgi:hypothetical protein